jgi:hypothetical protein
MRWSMGLLLLLLYVPGDAPAQCPIQAPLSSKLICLLPNASLQLDSSTLIPGQFFLADVGPVNQVVGIQLSQLPLASPSSGITFEYDPSLQTFVPSAEGSLGPVLGERAGTIGTRKLFFATTYQYFGFSTVDGQNLRNFPTIFPHLPIPASPSVPACPNQTGLAATPYAGDPCFVRDFIQTSNALDLKVHQLTLYATYGITQKLDFSVAIPVLDVRMAVKSNATIVPNSVAPPFLGLPGNVFSQFNPAVVPSCGTALPCLKAPFGLAESASGIGDVVLRGKYTVHKWERAGLAVGTEVRAPTGDAQNFLGLGATGVKPLAFFSYTARWSPHAEIGYEINGDSILGRQPTNQTPGQQRFSKGPLPRSFFYIVGGDTAVTRRVTAAFDIYGQRLFGAGKAIVSQLPDLGKCGDVNCTELAPGTLHPTVLATTTDLNITGASLGAKIRPAANLVFTGNVLLKLDDSGLRARAVPLVGISYSF